MDDKLDKRLLELLLYLIEKSENGRVAKTRLLKLFYLIDFLALETIGKKITGFNYNYYYYGPYSTQFIELLNIANGYEVVESATTNNKSEIIHLYELGKKPRVGSDLDSYSKRERDLIDRVIKEYMRLRFADLMARVYETKPMQKKEFGAKNIL